MERQRTRFGLRNIGALLALAAWSWYAASAGPELGLPGRDLGSLVSGLSRQGLWFLPIGFLVPLALPRMRGLLTGLFLVLLPSLALGAVVTALVAAAPEAAPWRVFENFVVPEPLPLLAPLVGMFAGVLLGTVFARGVGSALLLLPALAAIGAILLAIVAVALLLLTDRIATAEPIGLPEFPAGAPRTPVVAFPGGDGAPPAARGLETGFRFALAAAGVDPQLRLALVPVGDALELRASFPWQVPLLGERFFNLAAVSRPTIEGGVFRARFRSLRVGALPLPAVWVRSASRLFSRWLRRSSPVAPLLAHFGSPREEAAAGVPPDSLRPESWPPGAR